MLNIEKTLQSVRDLLDRLDKEGVDCGQPAPHASEYCISGMLIAFDGKTVWGDGVRRT